MKDLKLILQGFIIGIGKIIPGVSGAMFAMMFGVYEKALYIISHLKTELFKNLKFILLLGCSILLAIVFGSNIIKKCLDNYYLQTMFLFIGMMIAGIKPLFKNVRGKKISKKSLLCALLVSFVLIVLDCIDLGSNETELVKKPLTMIMLFFCGFLDATATIIPGICGTALLMILGYYDLVISSLGDLLNFNHLLDNLYVLVPFGIGMIIGIIIVSKVVNYLFEHFKTETYFTIIGFAIVSTLILFIKAISTSYTLIDLFISILLMIIGFIVTKLFQKIGEKY